MTNEPHEAPQDPFDEEAMKHHYGPDGPVEGVYRWLRLIQAGDFAAAWAYTGSVQRLCRAQAWLWNNRHALRLKDESALDRAASSLSAVPSVSPLWTDFAAIELDQLNHNWAHHFAAFAAGTMGAASRTRVIGVDLEVVLLMDTGEAGRMLFDQATLIHDAWVFMVRLVDSQWLVAAYGDFLPVPGWPPTLVPHEE